MVRKQRIEYLACPLKEAIQHGVMAHKGKGFTSKFALGEKQKWRKSHHELWMV
ncbi:MAG: hypothetical protein HQL89_06260 [Magnetococcales bacterium]|nr:hypothetical protein [Magnetococcales bacterium]